MVRAGFEATIFYQPDLGSVRPCPRPITGSRTQTAISGSTGSTTRMTGRTIGSTTTVVSTLCTATISTSSHSCVRPCIRSFVRQPEEARGLVELYNDYLRKDGVQLVAVDKLGSRSVYGPLGFELTRSRRRPRLTSTSFRCSRIRVRCTTSSGDRPQPRRRPVCRDRGQQGAGGVRVSDHPRRLR